MLFLHVRGEEELAATGTSYLNRSEAELVLNFVSDLNASGIKPAQIGIITPYRG